MSISNFLLLLELSLQCCLLEYRIIMLQNHLNWSQLWKSTYLVVNQSRRDYKGNWLEEIKWLHWSAFLLVKFILETVWEQKKGKAADITEWKAVVLTQDKKVVISLHSFSSVALGTHMVFPFLKTRISNTLLIGFT